MDPWNFLFRFPILLSFPKSPQVQNITSSNLDFTVIVLVVRIISSSQFFFPRAISSQKHRPQHMCNAIKFS